MKKQKFINSLSFGLALFAVICLSGCDPDAKNNSEREVVISTLFEKDGTRAAIADDLTFSWTKGDRIAVWAGGAFYTSDAYVADNKYTVRLSGVRDNYALYPANIADNANATGESLKVTLPGEYDFTDVAADYSPLPMIAVNAEGQDLYFTHLGGLLRITISNLPANADNVVVDLGKKINGSFPVHILSDGTFIVAGESGTEGSSKTKFLVDATASPAILNLPVPTGEYETITVDICDSNGTVLSSNTPPFSWTCERAHGKKFDNKMFKTIAINLAVNDWTTSTVGGDNSADLPQASQFVVTGVQNVYQIHHDSDGKKLRQHWVLGSNTATVSFEIFSPVGGTYSITPMGNTDKFTVTYVDGSAASGSIADPRTASKTKVAFTVSANSDATETDLLWFKVSVTSAAGVTYSLDSETQLYDSRGYHYFRLTDPLN